MVSNPVVATRFASSRLHPAPLLLPFALRLPLGEADGGPLACLYGGSQLGHPVQSRALLRCDR